MKLKCEDCGNINFALFKGVEVNKNYEGMLFLVTKYRTKFFVKTFDEDDSYIGDIDESKAVDDAYSKIESVDDFTCVMCNAEVIADF